MPFQKGRSGNPKGRPTGAKNRATSEIQDLARQYTPAALKELVRLSTKAESEQARVAACREILDRAYGKPAQAHTGPDGEPLTIPGAISFVFRQQEGAVNRT